MSAPTSFTKFRHIAEHVAVQAMMFVLARLPFRMSLWLGRRFGDIIRVFDRRHRVRAERQSAEILGLSEAEARRFAVENFRQYGMLLAELGLSTRMSWERMRAYLDKDSVEECRKRFESLLAEGHGLIFISAHYGNWEWSILFPGYWGFKGGAIARPMDNLYIDNFLVRNREKSGMHIYYKGRGFRSALRALRANGTVGILADQDAGRQAMLIPFLGKPASTTTIPIEMSMRTGAPMVVALLRRNRGKTGPHFIARVSEPIRPNPDAEPNAEARRLAKAMNDGLEKVIMEDPVQWFWIHRRWKTQDVREKDYSAKCDRGGEGEE